MMEPPRTPPDAPPVIRGDAPGRGSFSRVVGSSFRRPSPVAHTTGTLSHSMTSSTEQGFAVVAPGLEGAAAEELAALGIRGRAEPGGVSFPADRAQLYRVHLHARLPVRVWLRLGRVRARSLESLASGVQRLGWTGYTWP